MSSAARSICGCRASRRTTSNESHDGARRHLTTDQRSGHALSTLLAVEIVIRGTGKPRRESLHVDDCADALVHLVKMYSDVDHINLGSGNDLTISELARLVLEVVAFEGEIGHDLSKPDGTPRKLMSS